MSDLTSVALPVSSDDPADLEREVFESFPFGLLVFGEDGQLVRANEFAVDVFLRARVEKTPATCCELFGCGRPGTPLAGGCLTQIARANEGVLPEIRVDLHEGSPMRAAWLTAAPLREDGSLVTVQVRPGEPHDRRRGNVPHWTGGSDLWIYSLGRTRLETPRGPLGGKWLTGRAGQILKYLICERHRTVDAEEIAENVWRSSDAKSAGNLRYFVHELRSNLEPGREKGSRESLILSRPGGYGLDLTRTWVDADQFDDRSRAGLLAFQREAYEIAAPALRDAIGLYQGDFLADEPYAEWALIERDRMRTLASDALRALARMSVWHDDHEQACLYATRLGQLQPYDSSVHRQIIALMLARGRRSDAARHYAAFRERLAREFGDQPEFVLSDVTAGDADPG